MFDLPRPRHTATRIIHLAYALLQDMNNIFLIFLLVQTTAGCGYHSEDGSAS